MRENKDLDKGNWWNNSKTDLIKKMFANLAIYGATTFSVRYIAFPWWLAEKYDPASKKTAIIDIASLLIGVITTRFIDTEVLSYLKYYKKPVVINALKVPILSARINYHMLLGRWNKVASTFIEAESIYKAQMDIPKSLLLIGKSKTEEALKEIVVGTSEPTKEDLSLTGEETEIF